MSFALTLVVVVAAGNASMQLMLRSVVRLGWESRCLVEVEAAWKISRRLGRTRSGGSRLDIAQSPVHHHDEVLVHP